jgi:hypothetical protein
LNEDGTSLDQFVFTCFFDLLFSVIYNVEQGLHKLIFITTHHEIGRITDINCDINVVIFDVMINDFQKFIMPSTQKTVFDVSEAIETMMKIINPFVLSNERLI